MTTSTIAETETIARPAGVEFLQDDFEEIAHALGATIAQCDFEIHEAGEERHLVGKLKAEAVA